MKNNLIDLTHMINIIMIVFNVFNVLLAFINFWIHSDIIPIINITIVIISVVISCAEGIALEHNEKVLNNLYLRRELRK